MAYAFFEIPAWNGAEADVVYADPTQPSSTCYTHFANAIASTEVDWPGLVRRRAFTFGELRDWRAYAERFPSLRQHLQTTEGYCAGQSVLDRPDGDSSFRGLTAMRLGALELIANVGSGRIAANDKDPFPHQLQLQHFMRAQAGSVKRLLIADEVGLGKTIEIAMIVRDLLIAQGTLDDFSCMYFTSGGLVQDAQAKLKSVLKGAIGDQNIIQTVDSLRSFGKATVTRGIHVASMHAARLLTSAAAKSKLTPGIAPRIVIIDECHHCASDNDLTGRVPAEQSATTKTYLAAHQLLSGAFWPDSKPPELVVFMSATPFRSRNQFVNLLRLLTHGVQSFDAYDDGATTAVVSQKLNDIKPAVSIVWRRQDDPTVHSWRGKNTKLFPNLRVVRPHRDESDCPRLANTSSEYLDIMAEIRDTIKATMRRHATPFGGFAVAQLEKKLTSSSLAGACYLLSWCIRHSSWPTQEEFKQDESSGTAGIRELLRAISQRLAAFDTQKNAQHADVYLASEDFQFEAASIAQQKGRQLKIYELSNKVRRDNDEVFVADREEVFQLTELGKRLLSFSDPDRPSQQGVENAKLNWLRSMLEQFKDSRFLIFTESLQTCTIITTALPRESRPLVGSMGDSERDAVVKELGDPRSGVRVLVATSAADEGFDLQVANRVVHWDLNPSPAILMQRNGRVARLGQVSDVTAYYLILAGTHEERRDDALLERFGELGIDDEALRLRILGALTEEEEGELDAAIENKDTCTVGSILTRAARDNAEMASHLERLRTELEETSALSRDDLLRRLKAWQRLGLPEDVEFELAFDRVEWDRPVFGETTRLELAEADIAKVRRDVTERKFVFDPEYRLFGRGRHDLAGLHPWTIQKAPGRPPKHRPDAAVDLVGDLACALARRRYADFTTIGAERLYAGLPRLVGTRHILFVTHPMLEAETREERHAPYLTFHAFSEDLQELTPPLGASATDTHLLIGLLEEEALKVRGGRITAEDRDAAQITARDLMAWLRQRIKLGGDSLFDDRSEYFLPIPVAFVSIINARTQE